MNWTRLRPFPWLDTRAGFVSKIPQAGALLDLGSSDGETLGHIAELRPDLNLFAADKFGAPEKYPPQSQFCRADFERDRLPWPDASMDAITCMHVVEHLHELNLLLREIARLLKPGGRVYFETPHAKTLALPSVREVSGVRCEVSGKSGAPDPSHLTRGTSFDFTLNFYDDPTHVRLVTMDALAQQARDAGLQVEATGTSRNWLFAASHLFFIFLPPSRKKFTARVHWLGWSAYLIARRPT